MKSANIRLTPLHTPISDVKEAAQKPTKNT